MLLAVGTSESDPGSHTCASACQLPQCSAFRRKTGRRRRGPPITTRRHRLDHPARLSPVPLSWSAAVTGQVRALFGSTSVMKVNEFVRLAAKLVQVNRSLTPPDRLRPFNVASEHSRASCRRQVSRDRPLERESRTIDRGVTNQCLWRLSRLGRPAPGKIYWRALRISALRRLRSDSSRSSLGSRGREAPVSYDSARRTSSGWIAPAH